MSDAPQTDVERAYLAIAGKAPRAERYRAYYDGEQETPIVTRRLRDVYQDEFSELSENWSQVVIDATADRLVIEAFDGPDDGTTKELAGIVAEAELLLEDDEAHQDALIAGEGFVIAWADDDDGLEAYTQNPAHCHAFYDPAHPSRMSYAAKRHEDGRETVVTLYYADRIEEWRADTKALLENPRELADAFQPADLAPNPYGLIPVFHFRPQRRRCRSDLASVVPLQDAVNILVTNMLIGAEFSALPMKAVMTDSELPRRIRSEPNRIFELPGDAKIGAWDAAPLEKFVTVIDHFVNATAIISRTPRHYFYGTNEPPSGEALRVLEAPLVKKCRDRIARFTPTWQRLAAFLYLLRTGADLAPQAITVRYADPATVQPRHEAETRKIKADAVLSELSVGLSKKRGLMELGYSEEDAAAILEERQSESAAFGDALLTQFSRGNAE